MKTLMSGRSRTDRITMQGLKGTGQGVKSKPGCCQNCPGEPVRGPGQNPDRCCREASMTGPPGASWGHKHLNLPKAKDTIHDSGVAEQMGSTLISAPLFRGPRGNLGGRRLKQYPFRHWQ